MTLTEKAISAIKDYFESKAYGVCTYLAEKFNWSIPKLRNSFIYISFLSLGSPLIVYFLLAFWLDIRSYLKRKSIIWD